MPATQVTLRFVTWLNAAARATEADIMGLFAGWDTQSDARVAARVASAPVARGMSVTGAVKGSRYYEQDGLRTVTLVHHLDLNVAEGVTPNQVADVLDDYYDDMKAFVRTAVGTAHPRLGVSVVKWTTRYHHDDHVSRGRGEDEVEP